MAANAPTVVVIAGPNGAGKSTVAPSIVQHVFGSIAFVNADTIASGLSAIDPGHQAFAAGRIMLRHIRDLANAEQSFAFETTLASRTFAPFLQQLKTKDYRVHISYIWVRSVEIAAHRVRLRVATGGHHVPEETVRRRYVRSIHNLFHLYLPLADSWDVFDNSFPNRSQVIASGSRDADIMIYEPDTWNRLESLRDDT